MPLKYLENSFLWATLITENALHNVNNSPSVLVKESLKQNKNTLPNKQMVSGYSGSHMTWLAQGNSTYFYCQNIFCFLAYILYFCSFMYFKQKALILISNKLFCLADLCLGFLVQ